VTIRFRVAWLLPLLMASGGEALAQSQWAMVGRNPDLRFFVDRGTIARQGDVATMQQLIDYTFAQWVGAKVVMSENSVVEYDCGRRRMRTLAGAAYSEQLMRGVLVSQDRHPDAEWTAVAADGLPEQLWRIACGLD